LGLVRIEFTTRGGKSVFNQTLRIPVVLFPTVRPGTSFVRRRTLGVDFVSESVVIVGINRTEASEAVAVSPRKCNARSALIGSLGT